MLLDNRKSIRPVTTCANYPKCSLLATNGGRKSNGYQLIQHQLKNGPKMACAYVCVCVIVVVVQVYSKIELIKLSFYVPST